jgi:hypothetical protein
MTLVQPPKCTSPSTNDTDASAIRVRRQVVRTENLSPDLIQKLFERQNFFSRRKTVDSAEAQALPVKIDGDKSGDKSVHDSDGTSGLIAI